MEFKDCLYEQIKKHPSIMPLDIIKMCYQAAFGAEHLLSDKEKAWKYLKEEYDLTNPKKIDLFEEISKDVIRINLAAWKERNLPLEDLFNIFVSSCKVNENGEVHFKKYLKIFDENFSHFKLNFTREEWKKFISDYLKSGIKAVHHSKEYNEYEHPSYRIVSRAIFNSYLNK